MNEETKTNEALQVKTSERVAGDLIIALLTELKLMPDRWIRIDEHEQSEIIDRLRKRVNANVREAVRLIASDERISVVGELESVRFKQGVQAVLQIANRDPGRLDLADSIGKMCLIVVADAGKNLGGVDDTKPDSNQPDLPDLETTRALDQAMKRGKNPDDGTVGV